MAWVKADNSIWTMGPPVVAAFYRLPRFPGMTLYCSYKAFDSPIFYERSLSTSERQRRSSEVVDKIYLTTQSVTETTVQESEFHEADSFKTANTEDEVYMSPQLTKDLEGMFFGEEKQKKDSKKEVPTAR